MRSGLVVLVVALVVAAGCSDALDGPCGNGRLDPFEECDDGNIVSGDLCSQNCLREPSCGDHVIDSPMENCDDGNTVPGDNCDETCHVETVCGDLDIEPGEVCEDGNIDPGDGCSPQCTYEYRVGTKVRWRFVEAAGDETACPAGYDTVDVTLTAVRDDDTLATTQLSERVPCSDGVVQLRPFAARYRAQVRVTDQSDAAYGGIYEKTIDLRHGEQDVLAMYVVDGGYARLSWRLIDPLFQTEESCAHDGVSDIGITVTSATYTRSTYALCSTGEAVTPPMPAGDYMVNVVALDTVGNERGSASVPVTIGAPNDVVDLGAVDLSVVP